MNATQIADVLNDWLGDKLDTNNIEDLAFAFARDFDAWASFISMVEDNITY